MNRAGARKYSKVRDLIPHLSCLRASGALTSDRQIKLNDTRIVKGKRRSQALTATDIRADPPRAADDVSSASADAASARC